CTGPAAAEMGKIVLFWDSNAIKFLPSSDSLNVDLVIRGRSSEGPLTRWVDSPCRSCQVRTITFRPFTGAESFRAIYYMGSLLLRTMVFRRDRR
ncbi:MAG: hypothetical protein VXZ53_23505, partial [Planctomycetota bacterium]|nr:hypothetical protein [Planctomycetota bacterium]